MRWTPDEIRSMHDDIAKAWTSRALRMREREVKAALYHGKIDQQQHDEFIDAINKWRPIVRGNK